ncbi:hypothetical protein N7532_005292 [Penicillium argentinense]|uniref:Uncharacterized protein n=1 Tax=Penicillium argentinense TaxID=1131581 RepID=A0A9W9FDT5_9EURO|nr:uncharacterized protein N7532_005292 [Penicillium argentinense]KAJ5098291.1 hypothetical protein N7532_005292 [Penicillium argentinense]
MSSGLLKPEASSTLPGIGPAVHDPLQATPAARNWPDDQGNKEREREHFAAREEESREIQTYSHCSFAEI